jgi:hypothetical protein
MAHYAMAYSDVRTLARSLRRDERTVKDWLSAKKKVPFWVPELLRLRHMEACELNRQMRVYGPKAVLGVVRGDVIELAAQPGQSMKKPQSVTALRLDDFDQPAELMACSS